MVIYKTTTKNPVSFLMKKNRGTGEFRRQQPITQAVNWEKIESQGMNPKLEPCKVFPELEEVN